MFHKLGKLAKVAHEFLFFVKETSCVFILPIGSMGLVYLPTCTIKINHSCINIPYTSPMEPSWVLIPSLKLTVR